MQQREADKSAARSLQPTARMNGGVIMCTAHTHGQGYSWYAVLTTYANGTVQKIGEMLGIIKEFTKTGVQINVLQRNSPEFLQKLVLCISLTAP